MSRYDRLALEGLERLNLTGKPIQLEHERVLLITGAFRAALDSVQSSVLLPQDRTLMAQTFIGYLRQNVESEKPRALEVVKGETVE